MKEVELAKYWIYRLEKRWGDELRYSAIHWKLYNSLKGYLIDQNMYIKNPSLQQKIALQFAVPQKYYNINYRELRDNKFPNLFKCIILKRKHFNKNKNKWFTYTSKHDYYDDVLKQTHSLKNYSHEIFDIIPKPKDFAKHYVKLKKLVDDYNADSNEWEFCKFSDMNKFLIAITPKPLSEHIETLLDRINQEKLNIVNTKKKQEQSFKLPIEVPTGTTWKQISIIVFDNEHLLIKVPNYEERIDFANAGFADKRAKDKSKWKPNETWKILLEMAESKMINKDKHYAILSRGKGEPKQRLYKLNQTLRKLVMIDDNPINRYNRRNGGWIPKFNLIDKRDQTYSSKSEIEKLKRDLKI